MYDGLCHLLTFYLNYTVKKCLEEIVFNTFEVLKDVFMYIIYPWNKNNSDNLKWHRKETVVNVDKSVNIMDEGHDLNDV
jgi:hypothetical protein